MRSRRRRRSEPSQAARRCSGRPFSFHWSGPGRSNPAFVAITKPAGYGCKASAINRSLTSGPYESAVSIRLNPAATKTSSNLKDVCSSAVQPKTFQPNASGPTSNPEFPKLRFFIRLLRLRIARVSRLKRWRTCIWTHFSMRTRTLRQKPAYPERGTSQYLIRASLRSDWVCYLGI